MRIFLSLTLIVIFLLAPLSGIAAPSAEPSGKTSGERGIVQCANLIYAGSKSSVCYSEKFLTDLENETNIVTEKKFRTVRLDSIALFEFPFAVMTGEGAFTLTPSDRENLRDYLEGGGFLVASAGCSSSKWARSFKREIGEIFPERKLTTFDMAHPIFHTVRDIDRLRLRKGSRDNLQGLAIDGRIVLIFSSDGLNDTGNAGGDCCCCGGDEIRNAKAVNVNLLAYALTH